MKKLIISIFLIAFISLNLFSQTIPETFNYQAVARDYQGLPIANQDIVIEITINQGTDCESSGCNTLWQELHYPTTNEFGLFTVEIGNGQSTYAGSEVAFQNINWNDVTLGNYFLKVRVDFGGALFGNGLIDMGTTEFLAVPYSLASEFSNDVVRVGGKLPFNLTELADVNITTPLNSEILKWNGTEWINGTGGTGGATILPELNDVTFSGVPATNQVLLYNGAEWTNQALNLNTIGGVNIGIPSANQVLMYDGTEWTNITPVNPTYALADLTDVSLGVLAVDDVLSWNGTNWVNSTISAGSCLWTLTGSNVYYNSGNVGIGTITPTSLFHLNTTGTQNFLVTGEYNSATVIPNLGTGSKMVFSPVNSSLRAGNVTGAQWDGANIGLHSVAFGYNNTATGANSFAMGAGNMAFGTSSVAFGISNISNGAKSFTMGVSNTAGGDNSFAFGESCQTIGTTNAQGSFACGYTTQTTGRYTSAWGVGTRAREFAMMVVGHYNLTEGSGSQTTWGASATQPVFVIGNGTSLARADAFVVFQNGDAGLRGTLTTNAVIVPSDKTLKENIENVENVLADITKINAVTYTWKPETSLYKNMGDAKQIGFLAQDLEEVFPELVIDDVNLGYKTINYIGLIPILTEAIKEQQKQIEVLETENKSNSEKIELLIKKVSELESKISE